MAPIASRRKLNALALCPKVPLHQTNLIQPQGVLMILFNPAMDILQVSENVAALTGLPAKEIVGKPLSRFIAAEEAANLQVRFQQPVEGNLPLTFTFCKHGVLKKFLALVTIFQRLHSPDLYEGTGNGPAIIKKN